MSLTLASYHADVVPGWCRILQPVGPILEARRHYEELLDNIQGVLGVSGNTVKISFLFCAVDMYAQFYDPWGIWVHDSFDFSVGLSNIFDEQDFFSLFIGIYGDPGCAGWGEHIDEMPGWYHYFYRPGYFKNMQWALVEYEKVIPGFRNDLNQWRVHLLIDQALFPPHVSNSVFWFNQF